MTSIPSYSGPRPPNLLPIVTGGSAEAIVSSLFGLVTAVTASCCYRSLIDRLKEFDLEAKCASLDLLNRLVAHLQRLRVTDPELGAALSRGPQQAAAIAGRSKEDQRLEGPRLDVGRMYPNAIRQLIWPELKSEDDARTVVDLAGWVCLVYGIIGSLVYWANDAPHGAASIFGLLLRGGPCRAGMVVTSVGVCLRVFLCSVCCLVCMLRG